MVRMERVVQSMRAEGMRPDGEHQVAGGAEKGLVDDELVVAVLVEALQAGAVAAHAMHARRGIARELDPLGLERMELRDESRCAGNGITVDEVPSKRLTTRPRLGAPQDCPAKAAVSQPPSGLIEHSPSCMPAKAKMRRSARVPRSMAHSSPPCVPSESPPAFRHRGAAPRSTDGWARRGSTAAPRRRRARARTTAHRPCDSW